MAISLFSGCAVKPVIAPIDFAATQGVYLKEMTAHDYAVIADWGYGTPGAGAWNTRISEINAVNGGKGFHLDVRWGLYEKGASGGDFSNLSFLEAILDDLWDNHGLYVFLNPLIFRDFRFSSTSSLPLIDQMRYLLPEDMGSATSHSGLVQSPTVPVAQEHYAWNYAYAYDKNNGTGFGYDMKTYDATLRTRITAWLTAIKNRLGNHPAFIGITTTESIDGAPIYTGTGGYATPTVTTRQNYFDGKASIYRSAKSIFTRQIVAPSINMPAEGTFTPNPIDFVGDWLSTAEAEGYGVTSPNSNWWVGAINKTESGTTPQGVLRYYAAFTGPRLAQFQGDEVDSGVDGAPTISSTADFTTRYDNLYRRMAANGNATTLSFGMEATHIIVQRSMNYDVWLGDTTSGVPNIPNGTVVPSLSSFFNNATYVPQDGKAGLGGNTVSYWI